jgi:hypothetical protein
MLYNTVEHKTKMIKPKKKFVSVTPLSSKAKNRFVNIMQSLHSMEVEQETDNMFFLVSINRQYCTWVPKSGNEHWKIEK